MIPKLRANGLQILSVNTGPYPITILMDIFFPVAHPGQYCHPALFVSRIVALTLFAPAAIKLVNFVWNSLSIHVVMQKL